MHFGIGKDTHAPRSKTRTIHQIQITHEFSPQLSTFNHQLRVFTQHLRKEFAAKAIPETRTKSDTRGRSTPPEELKDFAEFGFLLGKPVFAGCNFWLAVCRLRCSGLAISLHKRGNHFQGFNSHLPKLQVPASALSNQNEGVKPHYNAHSAHSFCCKTNIWCQGTCA